MGGGTRTGRMAKAGAAVVAFTAFCLASCVAPNGLSPESGAPSQSAVVAEPVPNPRPAPPATGGTPDQADPEPGSGDSLSSDAGSDTSGDNRQGPSGQGLDGQGLDTGTSTEPAGPAQADPPTPGTTQAGAPAGDGSSGVVGSGSGSATTVPTDAGLNPATNAGQDPAPAAGTGPAVYYVALDDGGSQGIRFGCNDSLVAVRATAAQPGEPLAIALAQLLSPDDPTSVTSALYNALSGSALDYVSGYLQGATVVVNLTGQLQPGGVCDNPRIQAQLTQTAVAATGASRAEIYIDGRNLNELLNLR